MVSAKYKAHACHFFSTGTPLSCDAVSSVNGSIGE
jgi:hypothetical protein